MWAKRKSHTNAKGRSAAGRFVRLDHYLLDSAAYRSLSPNARSLLTELAMIDNGGNNGAIWLSVKDAAARIGLANLQSVSAAFNELQAAGFIRLTRNADFRVKASSTARARCWRLTWLSVPAASMAPTNEWKAYEPPAQSRERKRMLRGQQALKRFRKIRSEGKSPICDPNTLEPETVGGWPAAAHNSHPVLSKKRENLPKLNVCDSNAHTAAKGVRGRTSPLIHHESDLGVAVAALGNNLAAVDRTARG